MAFFSGTLKNRGGRGVLASEVTGEIDGHDHPRPPLVPHAVGGWFSAEVSAFHWDLSDGPPATLAIPGFGKVTIDLLSEVFVGQGWSVYRFEGRVDGPRGISANEPPLRTTEADPRSAEVDGTCRSRKGEGCHRARPCGHRPEIARRSARPAPPCRTSGPRRSTR
jgi:hypothetical protein